MAGWIWHPGQVATEWVWNRGQLARIWKEQPGQENLISLDQKSFYQQFYMQACRYQTKLLIVIIQSPKIHDAQAARWALLEDIDCAHDLNMSKVFKDESES